MAEEHKLEALLTAAKLAVRQVQKDADSLRDKQVVAHPVFMETLALALARASNNVENEEGLATFLSLAGRTVRAMDVTLLVLREVFLEEEAMVFATEALRKALHEVSVDTVPLLVEDIKSAPIDITVEDTYDESEDPITLDLSEE